jgi:hypothetical protein
MRHRFALSLVLWAALLAGPSARVGAQPTVTPASLSPEVIATVETWSRGAMMFVFFHEFGHMAIDLLKLPSTGPEEDAVDEFSTLILTELILQAPEAQKNLFAEVVRGGALFWKLLAERSEAKGHSTPFYDEHSPDIRRFANILCLATGADPLRFIPMAVKAGIPENRLHRCAGDYKRRHAAWNELMEKYGKHGQGQGQDKGKGGGRMTLKIEPSRKAAYKPFEEEFRRENFFQKVLDLMAGAVHLPRDVPVVVKECGMANAFWSPRAGEIILCYEMYAEIVQVFLAAAQGGDKPKGQPTTPAPQPRPGAGGPLVGTWQCQNNVVGSTEQLALGADGSFRSTARDYMGTVSSWGRWSIQGSLLTFQLVGYQPPQRSLPRQIDVTYSMPNANALQIGVAGTPPGHCQRLQ